MTDVIEVPAEVEVDREAEAKASAREFATTIGEKGFALAFGIMRYTYDSDKRLGDPLDLGRLHISEYAKLADTSAPTIKNYRIGYLYAVTLPEYADLPADPRPDTEAPVFRGAKFNGKAWTSVYKVAREKVATAAKEKKAEEKAERQEKAKVDPVVAAEIERETMLSGFSWVATAVDKLRDLAASPPEDLSVEKAAYLIAELSTLSDLALTAADAVKKFAPTSELPEA